MAAADGCGVRAGWAYIAGGVRGECEQCVSGVGEGCEQCACGVVPSAMSRSDAQLRRAQQPRAQTALDPAGTGRAGGQRAGAVPPRLGKARPCRVSRPAPRRRGGSARGAAAGRQTLGHPVPGTRCVPSGRLAPAGQHAVLSGRSCRARRAVPHPPASAGLPSPPQALPTSAARPACPALRRTASSAPATPTRSASSTPILRPPSRPSSPSRSLPRPGVPCSHLPSLDLRCGNGHRASVARPPSRRIPHPPARCSQSLRGLPSPGSACPAPLLPHTMIHPSGPGCLPALLLKRGCSAQQPSDGAARALPHPPSPAPVPTQRSKSQV